MNSGSATNESASKPFEVLIAGDVWPVPIARDELRTRLKLRELPDLFIWTLDAAVPAGPERPNVTRLPFEPASLDGLGLGKQTLVVTASNHLCDYGDSGTAATLRALEERGFRHTGAGANASQAAEDCYLDLPVGRVAVLAYAEVHPRVCSLAATETTAGIRPFEFDRCLDDIRRARKQADWVWVVLHWGEEFVRFPDPDQRRMARQMVEAGAALVVAAHTHVPLGFERWQEGVIYYGLGNFLFPPYREARGYHYAWHFAARQGVMAAGRFENGAWNWQPREIRLSPGGIPRLAAHPNCPDLGPLLATGDADYVEQFRRLRKRERLQFVVERLWSMSWQERAFRLRRLLGR